MCYSTCYTQRQGNRPRAGNQQKRGAKIEKINWKTRSGQEVEVTLEIVEETVSTGFDTEIGTGRWTIVRKCRLDGVPQENYIPKEHLPEKYRAAGVEYAIGQVAVLAENAERIREAWNRLKKDPRIVAMRENSKKSRKESYEYERSRASIAAQMQDGAK